MPNAKEYCLCGGVYIDGYCTLCGFAYVEATITQIEKITDRNLFKHGYAPAFQKQYCAECYTTLENYLCPNCDVDLVRDMTTVYHPYLWEMEPQDQLIAHALGVAL
jgi:hypothetical protein